MSEFLDLLERDLVEAARRRGRWHSRLGLRAPLLAAALLVVVGAGVTLAATGTIRIGAPVKVDRPPASVRNNAPEFPRVVPASVRLGSARAADPEGGPPWGVRTFRTTAGNVCAQAGRVVSGRLGVLGFDGAFHELPARTNLAACDYSPAGGHFAPRRVARDSAGRPTGARVTADGMFAPASTKRLDVNGMSTRLGCGQSFRPVSNDAITPCDMSRFRYVAWGVLRPNLQALETVRVPGHAKPVRSAPTPDRTFIYVLTGGDRRGARVRALMPSGPALPVVRAPRPFTVPTGHPDALLNDSVSPRVSPAAGGRHRTFTLTWRVPLPAQQRGDGWVYRIFGPGGQRCNLGSATRIYDRAGGIVPKRRAQERNEPLPPVRMLPTNGVRAGELVTRRLRPPGPPPRHWCPGRYRGEIRFNDKRIVATFAFVVR